MNAEPLLNKVARVFAAHHLEAIMVGNAAAALHGAPVTTLDIDFMFRKTPTNLRKLKQVANSLEATILKQFYPVSNRYRIVNEEQELQFDCFAMMPNDRAFDKLRSQTAAIQYGDRELRISAPKRVVRTSTRSAFREKPPKKIPSRKAREAALKQESELETRDQIRRLLALPMNKRTHFLRVRHPGGGSHL